MPAPHLSPLSGCLLALCLACGTAAAQDAATDGQATADPGAAEDVKILTIWNYDELYFSGFSVDEMLAHTTVVDPDGEAIGDVVDLVFRDDGALTAAIVQVGGFLDLGDTHLRVPWEAAVLSDAIRRLAVPFSGEAAEGSGAGEEVAEGGGAAEDEFLASDLLGDEAYFADGELRGLVQDLIVIDDRIAAVVIDAQSGGPLSEYYAYPYFEEGGGGLQARYGPRYDLPYEGQEIEVIEQFDYDRLRMRAN